MTRKPITIKGIPLSVQVREQPQQIQLPCLFRGDVTRTLQPGCCGSISVRGCAVFRECVQTREELQLLRNLENGSPARACGGCEERDKARPIVPPSSEPEPLPVTVGVPVRGCTQMLSAIVRLYQLQRGVNVQFLWADNGCNAEERELLESLPGRVLTVPQREYQHTSEPVCDAMQVIYDACDTDLLLQTHSDVLPADPWAVYDVAIQAMSAGTPVVGYQMSPRSQSPDWQRMASHTFTVFNRRAIGILNHSMADACKESGLDIRRQGGWPDTENGFNHFLTAKGITPRLLGRERNNELDKTPHYWHCRSLTCSSIFSPKYHAQAQEWVTEALQQAQQWFGTWQMDSDAVPKTSN